MSQRRFAVVVPHALEYVEVEEEPGADLAAAALDLAEQAGLVSNEHEQVLICDPRAIAVYNRGWHSNREDTAELGPASPAALFDQLRELARETPHVFVGRHDRDCNLCKLPDRDPIHKALIERPEQELH